jgi:FkbM family methyltransferase
VKPNGLLSKFKKNLALQAADLLRWSLDRFSPDEVETIARHVADRRRRDIDEKLVTFSRSLVRLQESFPNRFNENGERELINKVASLRFEVLFDVGANCGVWSSYAYDQIPNATIHAFEIVPSTFERLRAAVPMDSRIKLNPFGLAEESGEATVFLSQSDLLASLYDFGHPGSSTDRSVICEVRRGDEYCEEHEVFNIDFLKIDVEGAERRVLEGFTGMLSANRIRMLQFEYNRGAIVGHFLLRDAYTFLGHLGYILGRLTPHGVLFQEYHFSHENFIGPNYVACKLGDIKLINAISCAENHCN